MAARKKGASITTDPSVHGVEAIEILRFHRDRLDDLQTRGVTSAAWSTWKAGAMSALEQTHGKGSPAARRLEMIDYVPIVVGKEPWDEWRRGWVGNALELLGALLEEQEFLLKRASPRGPDRPTRPAATASRRVFIVHGHDDAAREETARFVSKLNLQPIILHEQANEGRTIIEKFEGNALDVAFAIVLLTPDDVGSARGAPPESLRPRARQNCVFELGFFVAALGRARVCALTKGDIEVPSDLHGVVYVPMDAGGGWKLRVAREMVAAGLGIDMNDAL